uniref:Uncharacterized protein n=1 Tax=Megaselia scalaris TaxID=36166 RepID=T1GM58_MEGSC
MFRFEAYELPMYMYSRVVKRIQQHSTTCKDPKHKDKSSLADHHHSLSHNFDFQNFKILDFEPNHVKRRISEMIYITMQGENKVNVRSDTENLSTSYKNLIEKSNKNRDSNRSTT